MDAYSSRVKKRADALDKVFAETDASKSNPNPNLNPNPNPNEKVQLEAEAKMKEGNSEV